MFLKRVEIQGFKTFESKVILEFNNPLVAIVGPNGSGKSNIVDAIRWALGEQNLRILRARDSKELIFSGSKSKKPLSYANVKVVFDNSSEIFKNLPESVEIERKIYRSKETFSYINDKELLLKDIENTLFETGFGFRSYPFVNQGEVSKILHMKPEERKVLFDEVAGITFYKDKKKEIIRKLERTLDNINRIEDLLRELKKEEEHLKNQAKDAKNYVELKNKLLYLERLNFTLKGLIFNQSIARDEKKLDEIKEKEKSVLETLENLKLDIFKKKEEKEEILKEISLIQKEKTDCINQKFVFEKELALIREKNYNFEKIEASFNKTLADERSLRESARREIERLNPEIAFLEGEEERLREEKGLLNREIENLRVQYESFQNIQEDELSFSRKEFENLKAEVIQLKTLLDNAIKIEEDLNKTKENLNKVSLEEFSREINSLDEEAKELSYKKEEVKNLKDEIKNSIALKENELKEKKENLVLLQKNFNETKEILEDEEKLFNKKVSSINEKFKDLKAIDVSLNPVIDFVTIEGYKRCLIVDFLDDILEAIILDTKEFYSHYEILKEKNFSFNVILKENLEIPGILNQEASDHNIYPILNFIKTEDKNLNILLRKILNSYYVAPSLDEAIKFSKEHPSFKKIFTLQGDVLENNLIYVNKFKNGFDALNLQGSFKELELEIKTLNDQINEFTQEIIKLKNDEQDFVLKLFDLDKETTRLSKVLADKKMNYTILLEKKENLKSEEEKIKYEIKEKTKEYNTKFSNLKELEERLTSAENAFNAKKKEKESLRDELFQLEKEVDSLKFTEQKTSFEKISKIERRNALQNRILNSEKREKELFINFANDEKIILPLKEKEKILETELSNLKSSIDGLEKKEKDTYLSLEKLKEALLVNEKETENLGSSLLRLKNLEREKELSLASNFGKLEELKKMFSEEFNEDFDSAVKDIEDKNFKLAQNIQDEIEEIKSQMVLLEPINMASIEEEKALSKRIENLEHELSDLISTREGLLQIIGDLDLKIKEIFKETLTKIEENFEENFLKIFEEGEAKLIHIEENGEIKGIDISVRLPGKRTQPLELLSGGEKALVAITLLFAFFKTRPSLFYLLDEVDSALDDENVSRFVKLIREYKDTQFIVVTHNKETMMAADTLYGVTMEEDGISKMVSLQVS